MEHDIRLTNQERACMRRKGADWYIDMNMFKFPVNEARLFVCNLHKSVKNQHLFRAFEHYNSFIRAPVKLNPQKDYKSKNFGFVSLGSEAECEHVLVHMNGKMLHRKPLMVKRSNWSKNMDQDFKRQSALAPTLDYKIYGPKKK